jgi:hypothetical protein
MSREAPKATVPTPPDNAVLSPDGQHWWDGARWIPVTDAPPSNALLSPDGSQWWDGTSWKPIPPEPASKYRWEPASEYGDAGYEDVPPDNHPAESALSLETVRAAPGGLIAIAGGLALVLGAFLPWLSFSAVFVGTIDVSGFSGGDGWAFIVFALAAIICGVGAIRGQSQLGLSVGLLTSGALAAIVVGVEFANLGGRIDTANQTAQGYGVGSYGTGLYVLVLGAAGVIVGGGFELSRWSAGRHGNDD